MRKTFQDNGSVPNLINTRHFTLNLAVLNFGLFSFALAEGTLLAKVRDEPLLMQVGFYVNSIRSIDWESGSFKADIYWWVRRELNSSVENNVPPEDIEEIEFVNADLTSMVQELLDRSTVVIEGKQHNLSVYRTVADFNFETDFHRYPFDEQVLEIALEHKKLSNDRLVFEIDRLSYDRFESPSHQTGISPAFKIPDFELVDIEHHVTANHYHTDFGEVGTNAAIEGMTYSRAELKLRIQRLSMPYLTKILIPVAICLILPYLVFFIPGAELEVAVGLTVTSLLTCVAIQLTVVPGLPNIGYLATSDLIFYLAYVLAMLAMAQTVWTYRLEIQGQEQLAKKWDLLCRWVYPLCFLAGMLLILVL